MGSREVEAFGTGSRQRGTTVRPFRSQAPGPSEGVRSGTFRAFYEGGTFPFQLGHGGALGRTLEWRLAPEAVDWTATLYLCLDGLTETEEPLAFFAEQGALALVQVPLGNVERHVPRLVAALRPPLLLQRLDKTAFVLRFVCELILRQGPGVAAALVPQLRLLLPPLRPWQTSNRLLPAKAPHGLRPSLTVAQLLRHTLDLIAAQGGPHAASHIRHVFPTYAA